MVAQKYYCRACAASGATLQPTRTNGLAVTSLVLGIISIPLGFCYGFGVLLGIPAFILGLVARRQIEQSGGTQSGQGLAIAGMITGGLTAGLIVLSVVVIVILALLGPAVGNVFSNIVMEI
jgi:hypothetical protein